MQRLDKIAQTVALVPSRVDHLPSVDPLVPRAPESPSRPHPGLPWFIPRFITGITLRVLRYAKRGARSATTLQLVADGVQESTASSTEDTNSNAIPPPIARPRIQGAPVALVPKKGLSM